MTGIRFSENNGRSGNGETKNLVHDGAPKLRSCNRICYQCLNFDRRDRRLVHDCA